MVASANMEIIYAKRIFTFRSVHIENDEKYCA
jgi:hypothetical protein